MQQFQQLPEQIKLAADGVAVVGWVSALLGYLPVLAALASFIWTCLRIYELKTVQKWLKKNKR